MKIIHTSDWHLGQEFYSYAIDLLNTREKAFASIHDRRDDLEGILEIQTSTIPGHYYLPKLMAGFHKKYPKVRFYVEQTDIEQMDRQVMDDDSYGIWN